jgi:hypothetical protein
MHVGRATSIRVPPMHICAIKKRLFISNATEMNASRSFVEALEFLHA